jgi:hypothetical protein
LQDRESSGGVRFNVVDNNEEGANYSEEKQRLHRRDTPHHLKNKRINQQVWGILNLFKAGTYIMAEVGKKTCNSPRCFVDDILVSSLLISTLLLTD